MIKIKTPTAKIIRLITVRVAVVKNGGSEMLSAFFIESNVSNKKIIPSADRI